MFYNYSNEEILNNALNSSEEDKPKLFEVLIERLEYAIQVEDEKEDLESENRDLIFEKEKLESENRDLIFEKKKLEDRSALLEKVVKEQVSDINKRIDNVDQYLTMLMGQEGGKS